MVAPMVIATHGAESNWHLVGISKGSLARAIVRGCVVRSYFSKVTDGTQTRDHRNRDPEAPARQGGRSHAREIRTARRVQQQAGGTGFLAISLRGARA